ncbi:MAG: iron-containing alcohol dehydrogenase [Clostridia bacterium]|nr:iron-containing alcohol dehydrogenase [Clostridia bacterium]
MSINLKNAYYRTYQKAFKVVMPVFNWDEPELLKGPGAIKDLPALVKSKGVNNVLIVTDKGLMSLNLLDSLFENLEKQNIKYTVYDGVQPNPSIENIEEARRIYLKNNCEGIIAFGGGSPMDCAKVAGARVSNPNTTVSQMRGLLKVFKKLPPFFAVPTTAGTGSETTLAAVVSNMQTHEKYAINDPKLRPKYAVLDPELTTGLPKKITSTTGMDALTHAVEAYIGQSGVKSTDDYAEKATKLIFDNLEKAYEDGKDIEARENMLVASFYAGMAFTRAYVGYVHAIAHNLGGLYGTPHGLANAVILPHVLEYYGETAHEKLAKLADIVGIDGDSDKEKAEKFIEEIKEMNEEMDIPEHFDFIKDEDIPTIVARALKEGNPLYPVPKIMDEEDCTKVVKAIRGF